MNIRDEEQIYDDLLIQNLISISTQCRKWILEITHLSNTSHVGSSLSCVDILVNIFKTQNLILADNNSHSKKPSSNHDVLVFSKGHAAAGFYSVARACGYISDTDWLSYCKEGSSFLGHVSHDNKSFVELSTGSLGHGMPFALGIAMGKRNLGLKGAVFAIISDGECDEGTTWESALIAAHHKLSNLVVVIDRNRLQSIRGTEETLSLEPLSEKWSAFGWKVRKVDGHDHVNLKEAFDECLSSDKPTCIIANTIKGKGISYMENNNAWHYKFPTESELETGFYELNREHG